MTLKLTQHTNQQSAAKAMAARRAHSTSRDSRPNSPMLDLQRTRGNQFVQRIMQGQMVQRKLAVNQPGSSRKLIGWRNRSCACLFRRPGVRRT